MNDDVTKRSSERKPNNDNGNNKNILDRFLESRRQNSKSEDTTKDPFESLLISLDQDDKDFDVTRLEQKIVKIEESLIQVKEILGNYQRRTLTVEEVKLAETETKRLTGLRKELELRRKKLILEKTKLDREILQKKAKISDNIPRLQLNEKTNNQISDATPYSDNNAVITEKRKKFQKLDTNETFNKIENNNSTSLISNTQNLVSSVLDSILSKQKAKRGGWVFLCPKTLISPGEVVPIVVGGLDLLIIGSRDGKKVYCVANSCPHLGTPLETGMIERRPREDNRKRSIDKDSRKTTLKQNRAGNALLATDEKKTNGESNENDSLPQKKTNKMFSPRTKNFENKESSKNSKQQWPAPVTSLDDGCEECIVCPLHQTAFALESGEVRGKWCPYPPMLGKVMGNVRRESTLPTFLMRIRGKNIEVRLNSCLED